MDLDPLRPSLKAHALFDFTQGKAEDFLYDCADPNKYSGVNFSPTGLHVQAIGHLLLGQYDRAQELAVPSIVAWQEIERYESSMKSPKAEELSRALVPVHTDLRDLLAAIHNQRHGHEQFSFKLKF
ncbi:MAG: hypothetical protein KDD55_09350 [Bdellovibrionales bacterium]|nr:hypothetical protein [Bdellovibrionales bacterium]